jgi:hypothetical protein
VTATELHWRVVEGPTAEHAPDEGRQVWAFVLAQGSARRRMVVEISAALVAGAPGTQVGPPAARALATRGRSEVEEVSRWWDPPARSIFDARNQPSRIGGRP